MWSRATRPRESELRSEAAGESPAPHRALRCIEIDVVGWRQMNRTYELMFIVRPDMVEEEQDKLISTLETAVTSSGGNVKSVEKMGKRRLAYMVRRFHDGIFVL